MPKIIKVCPVRVAPFPQLAAIEIQSPFFGWTQPFSFPWLINEMSNMLDFITSIVTVGELIQFMESNYTFFMWQALCVPHPGAIKERKSFQYFDLACCRNAFSTQPETCIHGTLLVKKTEKSERRQSRNALPIFRE